MCLLLAVSFVAPIDWAVGLNGVSLRHGTLQLAHGNVPLTPRQGAWMLTLGGGRGTILLGPTSGWRPHTGSGSVIAGPFAGAVSAVFVPLWPWALVLMGAWLLLRRMVFKARRPYECESCGYDRRGLASESTPCPECSGVPAAPQTF